MHYKDPTNTVHWLDSAEFEHLLPEGSVSISDEEAEQLRIAARPAPDTKAEALAYLLSTDWYVTRKAETGKEIPTGVLVNRASARVAAK